MNYKNVKRIQLTEGNASNIVNKILKLKLTVVIIIPQYFSKDLYITNKLFKYNYTLEKVLIMVKGHPEYAGLYTLNDVN